MDETNEGEVFGRSRGPNNDICHVNINSILKKVLKKLKISQEVEMKAYQMVEEIMLKETQITTTKIPFLKKLAKLFLQKLSI